MFLTIITNLLFVLVVLAKLAVPAGAGVGCFLIAADLRERDKEDSLLHAACIKLGVLGLATPTLYAAIFGISYLTLPRPVYPALWHLAAWSFWTCAGIAAALAFLRLGASILDRVKSKLTRKTDLERNRKTDVREIGKFLPTAASFDPLKYIDLKRGLFLGLDEKRSPVYIDFGGGTAAPHVQVVGTTGAGKGVSLGVMAAQFLERGEAVFFCDPKNDEWAPHLLFQEAGKLGVPYSFIDLNPPAGLQFNPFSGASREEIAELFMAAFSLTERGDASDFYGIADRRAAQIAARLMAEGEGMTAAQLFNSEHFEGLEAMAEKFAGKIRELAGIPAINAPSGIGVDMATLIERGGCMYIVGSMRNDNVKTVQRLLLVRMIQLAERRDRMDSPLRPVCIVLDEVKYHLSRPALEGLGAARDKGVHLVLAHQSLGDLRDCPKDLDPDAVVDAIVENCRLKLCYKVQNPKTAEWLSEMSGSILVDDEARKVRKNLALAETMDNDRTIRQADRYLVDTNMLQNLPPSMGVLYGSGLPRFVTIKPIPTNKNREAVTPAVVPAGPGSVVMPPAAALSLDDEPPPPPAAPGVSKGSALDIHEDIQGEAGSAPPRPPAAPQAPRPSPLALDDELPL